MYSQFHKYLAIDKIIIIWQKYEVFSFIQHLDLIVESWKSAL